MTYYNTRVEITVARRAIAESVAIMQTGVAYNISSLNFPQRPTTWLRLACCVCLSLISNYYESHSHRFRLFLRCKLDAFLYSYMHLPLIFLYIVVSTGTKQTLIICYVKL
jgi:hypothetical protein